MVNTRYVRGIPQGVFKDMFSANKMVQQRYTIGI